MQREKKSPANGNGANLGFEATLWAAADKMRNNMDTAEPAARWCRSRVTQPASSKEPALHV